MLTCAESRLLAAPLLRDHDREGLEAADVEGLPRYSGKGTAICVPSLLRNMLPS
jgi:hypothetical protein